MLQIAQLAFSCFIIFSYIYFLYIQRYMLHLTNTYIKYWGACKIYYKRSLHLLS
jgi:hypothetical protein